MDILEGGGRASLATGKKLKCSGNNFTLIEEVRQRAKDRGQADGDR